MSMQYKSGPRANILFVLLLTCGFMAAPVAFGQAPASPPAPPPGQQKTPPKPPAEANPFPEDTTTVPVMPDANTPAAPETPAEPEAFAPALPAGDADPVRSPDEPSPDVAGSNSSESSSSFAGMENLLPAPDVPARDRRGKPAPAEHQESAADDENVGQYYLSTRNWKAALSRFQSALVLDPDNPDVYWGLAEAERHLGDLPNAKANYQKLVEYDPDGKHAKEAKRLLKSPELNNAPTASAARPGTQVQ